MVIEMTGFGLNRTDETLFRNSYSMMNLQQLNHFDDSLTVDLNEILDKFKSTMDKSLIGKSKNIMIKTGESVPDSIETVEEAGAIKIQPVFVDTLFASLNKLERRKAISQAINFARSNKSITTSNVGTAEWKVSRLRRYQNEIHRKYSYSILCLIFFFIGAPLGAIIRKGGLGMPVIVSVLLFLVYYVISMVGEKFSREGMVPPSIGMWISTFILAPVSIWLTQKAVKDSVILNIETYFTWFKKWRLRLKNRLQSP
jgi:lipopolysaccharide export system permease protein